MNWKIQKSLVIGIVVILGESMSLSGQGLRTAISSSGEILSGGPSLDEAKAALESRIEKQSGGKITLLEFEPTGTREANVELQERTFIEFGFQATIAFSEACKWVPSFGGRPLTFEVLKTNEQNSLVSSFPGRSITISKPGEHYGFFGSVWFMPSTNGWVFAGFSKKGEPKPTVDIASARCEANLKEIGLAFRMWSGDHGDHFPFNVRKQDGGTKELCQMGLESFDVNTPAHFQVMSNELGSPKILVCPDDSTKHPAKTFENLNWTNVSYRIRSGDSVDEANPQEVLAVCPIHGYKILCDGTVRRRKSN